MTYPAAIEFLYSLRMFGAKLGLENTFKLAALAGNPQQNLRFIHVAGTNGKGSTCAMLESTYRAAGLRVGLFTSPHLVAFGERMQVNRQLIAEAEVVRLVEEMQAWLKAFSHEAHPTFFEVVTVMALHHFANEKCDLVIWETGLGGRLDSTNIVTPLVSVITNIQFDHQKWLGETLEKIAFEKAGIIKPRVPVITATDAPEALAVIRARAEELKAPLEIVTEVETRKSPLPTIALPLLGQHQRLNAAVALRVVEQLQDTIPVNDAAIRRGLETVFWAGRLQLIARPNGKRLLLDGAHNTAGAAALVRTLADEFPGQARTLILGMLADKDCAEFCRIIAPGFARILVVPVSSDRTAAPEEIRLFCQAPNPAAEVVLPGGLAAALQAVANEPLTVIAGSLYLAGEVLDHLGLAPGADKGERGLNEWGGVPPKAKG